MVMNYWSLQDGDINSSSEKDRSAVVRRQSSVVIAKDKQKRQSINQSLSIEALILFLD
jgi:hypothetical protein